MTEVRAYKSEVLRRTTEGTSGSSVVGVPPITGLSAQANNVETALRELAGAQFRSASETQGGIVELATATETQAGTDNTRAVHPAGLKSELDRRGPIDAYAELTLSVGQSIPDSAFAAVAWDTETRDPQGWHGTTNPQRVTPGVAGMYLVTLFTVWAASSTGVRRMRLIEDGTVGAQDITAVHAGFTTAPQTLSALVYLGATGYIEAQVYQNSGAPLDLSVGSRLTVSRVV